MRARDMTGYDLQELNIPGCPFCGSWDLYVGIPRRRCVVICCYKCNAHGPVVLASEDHKMVELWSSRSAKVAEPRGGFAGCPWCGEKKDAAVEWSVYENKFRWAAVGCKRCGVGGPPSICADEDVFGKVATRFAIKQWNKRMEG